MTDERTRSVAFSGHRHYCSDKGLARRLEQLLEELIAAGADTFYCGMAVGFDLAAGEAVLALRARHPGVRLIAAVPHPGQADRMGAADRLRYDRLLARCDRVDLLSRHYSRDCYLRRNDYLVAHASTLVCWYDGSRGGTDYTVRMAEAEGLAIRNLRYE